MSEQATTPFSNITAILAELWMDYRDQEGFAELFTYGDLGFPLAYSIYEKIVEPSPLAEEYITELWNLFLSELEVEDTGQFEVLADVFDSAPYPDK